MSDDQRSQVALFGQAAATEPAALDPAMRKLTPKGPASPAITATRRFRRGIFLGAFSLAILFAWYTDHAWEDYYITYRVSKNLAEGHGLVYTPGERVHVFTSPLGVLIPAALNLATGDSSDALVLWLFRILSSLAFALAALLLLRLAQALSLSWLPAVFLFGMFAIDLKTVDNTINGMETGLMVLFLSLALKALIAPGRSPALESGLAWGGLMWTRPDSCIYIGALALGFLAFRAGPLAESRRKMAGIFFRAGLIAAVLYFPWILWSWSYYGSPIPHTVLAKGLHRGQTVGDLLLSFVLLPAQSLISGRAFQAMLLPAYAAMGGWPHWLESYSSIIAWLCAFYWCLPRGVATARALSLAFMFVAFYLNSVAPFPFPWYLPGCTLLGLVLLALILQQALRTGRTLAASGAIAAARVTVIAARTATGGILAVGLALTLAGACQLRIQQTEIEEGNRKKIGLWLATHSASPSDTVFLEPLGYIGFFSGLRMQDFPGLSSPAVVAARRETGSDSAATLIRALNPNWLVLRPAEEASIHRGDSKLLGESYQPARTFDVADRIRSYRWLPGRSYLEYDQTFTVYRRSGQSRLHPANGPQ